MRRELLYTCCCLLVPYYTSPLHYSPTVWIMAYADEDEIDWSDGPLDPPSPDSIEPTAGSGHFKPIAETYEEHDSLFIPDTEGQYNKPCGLPFDLGKKTAMNKDVGLTLRSYL
jgi:hypothetical protein